MLVVLCGGSRWNIRFPRLWFSSNALAGGWLAFETSKRDFWDESIARSPGGENFKPGVWLSALSVATARHPLLEIFPLVMAVLYVHRMYVCTFTPAFWVSLVANSICLW